MVVLQRFQLKIFCFQVIYQIANLYELLGDIDQAIEWYLQLLGLIPTDPVILQKMGTLFDNEGDKQQAYQYHFDSYRYFPSNLEVIDWLGSYFIEMQVSEKAIGYFERASLMQPDDVKWQLMIASCYRRSGNYHKALDTYKVRHAAYTFFHGAGTCIKLHLNFPFFASIDDSQKISRKCRVSEVPGKDFQ